MPIVHRLLYLIQLAFKVILLLFFYFWFYARCGISLYYCGGTTNWMIKFVCVWNDNITQRNHKNRTITKIVLHTITRGQHDRGAIQSNLATQILTANTILSVYSNRFSCFHKGVTVFHIVLDKNCTSFEKHLMLFTLIPATTKSIG